MGTVCCPLLCGDKCGGTGCGPVSYENCCAGGIVDSDIFCEDSETAPCIIGECMLKSLGCVEEPSLDFMGFFFYAFRIGSLLSARTRANLTGFDRRVVAGSPLVSE